MSKRQKIFWAIFGALFVVSAVTEIALKKRPDAAAAPTQAQIHTGTPFDVVAQYPDWLGSWEVDTTPSILQTNTAVPLTPDYAAKLADLRAKVKAGGELPGNPKCKPAGMPLFMDQKGPLIDILYSPGRIVFHSGSFETRLIHMDAAASEAPLDFFDGTETGHWEGDTLVVETTGILPEVEVFPGIPNGGGLHVSERMRMVSPDKLEDKITLTGDGIFTAPYTYTRTLTRHKNWAVTDYVCLTTFNASFGVGPKPSDEDLLAATDKKPPVRQIAAPAANAASLPGGTWESVAKLPDMAKLGGLWSYNRAINETQPNYSGPPIPLAPVFAKKYEELKEAARSGGDIPTNNYHCWPRGAIQTMKGAETDFIIMYQPGRVTTVNYDGSARRIYTDGRGHPENLEVSFMGHSIGHWEGETLVVDTVGLRPDMQIFNGMDSGGGLHAEQRIHLLKPTQFQVDTTVLQATALTAPWSYSRTYSYRGKEDLMEDYCAQNNRDVDSSTSMQGFDLTPPPQ